jgi:Flp pilus assembly pilin Flp
MLRKRSYRGQGLAEYALIIALVAIVVVAIGLVLGLAVQRGFGLVTGALNNTSSNSGSLMITNSVCGTVPGQTGMRVHGLTNIPLDQLQMETNLTANGDGWDSDKDGSKEVTQFVLHNSTSGTFLWNPMIDATTDNLDLCPSVVFVRTKNGTIGAAAPVIKKDCSAPGTCS